MRLIKFKKGESVQRDIGQKLNKMVDKLNQLNIRGDQKTIKVNRMSGVITISAINKSGGGSFDGSYDGSFAVSIKDNKINVSEGWLNRNGDFVSVPAVEGIEPATGWLCICSTIENSDWTYPEIKIAEPAADAFPIAKIEIEGENIAIRQLPVVVAVIMLAKVCPMAEF